MDNNMLAYLWFGSLIFLVAHAGEHKSYEMVLVSDTADKITLAVRIAFPSESTTPLLHMINSSVLSPDEKQSRIKHISEIAAMYDRTIRYEMMLVNQYGYAELGSEFMTSDMKFDVTCPLNGSCDVERTKEVPEANPRVFTASDILYGRSELRKRRGIASGLRHLGKLLSRIPRKIGRALRHHPYRSLFRIAKFSIYTYLGFEIFDSIVTKWLPANADLDAIVTKLQAVDTLTVQIDEKIVGINSLNTEIHHQILTDMRESFIDASSWGDQLGHLDRALAYIASSTAMAIRGLHGGQLPSPIIPAEAAREVYQFISPSLAQQPLALTLYPLQVLVADIPRNMLWIGARIPRDEEYLIGQRMKSEFPSRVVRNPTTGDVCLYSTPVTETFTPLESGVLLLPTHSIERRACVSTPNLLWCPTTALTPLRRINEVSTCYNGLVPRPRHKRDNSPSDEWKRVLDNFHVPLPHNSNLTELLHAQAKNIDSLMNTIRSLNNSHHQLEETVKNHGSSGHSSWWDKLLIIWASFLSLLAMAFIVSLVRSFLMNRWRKRRLTAALKETLDDHNL